MGTSYPANTPVRALNKTCPDSSNPGKTSTDGQNLWKNLFRSLPVAQGESWNQTVENYGEGFSAYVSSSIEEPGLPAKAFACTYAMYFPPHDDDYFSALGPIMGIPANFLRIVRLRSVVAQFARSATLDLGDGGSGDDGNLGGNEPDEGEEGNEFEEDEEEEFPEEPGGEDEDEEEDDLDEDEFNGNGDGSGSDGAEEADEDFDEDEYADESGKEEDDDDFEEEYEEDEDLDLDDEDDDDEGELDPDEDRLASPMKPQQSSVAPSRLNFADYRERSTFKSAGDNGILSSGYVDLEFT